MSTREQARALVEKNAEKFPRGTKTRELARHEWVLKRRARNQRIVSQAKKMAYSSR